VAKKSVTQLLRALTYRDMVDFSEIVAQELNNAGHPEIEASTIADVFVALPAHNEQTDETNQILQSMFRRKRVFSIQPLKEGVFKISCASFEGAVVFEKDIREGVSQLLDTLTVLKALE